MDLGTLMRPDLAALQPYTPIVPFEALSERLGIPAAEIVKLDANENPYGPSPRAIEALAAYPHYAIYPDPDQTALRRAIASVYRAAGRAYRVRQRLRRDHRPAAAPDRRARRGGRRGAADVRNVSLQRRRRRRAGGAGAARRALRRRRRADRRAVEREQAKIVFLPSPNNPTGNALSRAAVERLLELPALLVVDEAYAEFSGDSVADLVGQASQSGGAAHVFEMGRAGRAARRLRADRRSR